MNTLNDCNPNGGPTGHGSPYGLQMSNMMIYKILKYFPDIADNGMVYRFQKS